MKSLTTSQIMEIAGLKSENSVRSKNGIENYIAGYNHDGPGRPQKLYTPEVLKLFKVDPSLYKNSITEEKVSLKRADYGTPRSIKKDVWDIAVNRAKQVYLSMPTKNLLEACRMTASKAKLENIEIDGEKLYRRLTRRRTKTNEYTSPYYSERWEKLHDAKFRIRNNRFYNHPTTIYNWFAIFESYGLAGKGYGSRRVIVVDDFKRDVWVDDDGSMTMPWGLMFMDALTNMPLMVVPCESITTDIVAAGILMTAFAHGIHDDTIWIFETSRAMKNDNVKGLINSLYSNEQLKRFKSKEYSWVSKMYPGQTGPYINSPAYVAQSKFKSKIERSFRNFKDEFDGVYWPTQYQGGDRKEGVQLTLAGSPLDIKSQEKPGQTEIPYSQRLFPISGYWQRFFNWVFGKYIQTPRVDMFKNFIRQRNSSGNVSIMDVYNFYTSDNDGSFKPDLSNLEKLAMCLFHAQPYRHKFTVKINRIGAVNTTIDKRHLNLIAEQLTEADIDKRVCVIPIPEYQDNFLIIDVTVADKPKFLTIAEDLTAQTVDDIKRMNRRVRLMREKNIERMREDAKSNTIELDDDFSYTAKIPGTESWTKILGAKQSKFIETQDSDAVQSQNIASQDSDAVQTQNISSHEELVILNPKLKDILDNDL